MRLHQYLKEDQVELDFSPELPPRPEDEDPDAPPTPRQLWAEKEAVLDALVTLLESSGKVANRKKLLLDLVNRERRATTGLGSGIAMPHVRTPQAKGFAMAVAVAKQGIAFDSVDGEPVKLFVAMVAPAYDDRFYLRAERDLAAAFANGTDVRDQLVETTSKGELIRLLAKVVG